MSNLVYIEIFMLKPKQLLDETALVFEEKQLIIWHWFLILVSIELNINCLHKKGKLHFKICFWLDRVEWVWVGVVTRFSIIQSSGMRPFRLRTKMCYEDDSVLQNVQPKPRNWGFTKISNIFNKATIVEIFLLVLLNEVYWCILTRTNLTNIKVIVNIIFTGKHLCCILFLILQLY